MDSIDLQLGKTYNFDGILGKIIDNFVLAGKDINTMTVDDLAPVDAFHTRGRAATREAAALVEIQSSDHILDVGCALGGTARHLAEKYGCKVTGIDYTEHYIVTGKKLTELVGLDRRVELLHGNALDMPFEADTFDIVWTEHVQMNIADKEGFYGQIARVLKPAGRFLFHDVFRGTGSPPVYPVPWADVGSMSVLASESGARQTMEETGLEIDQWIVKTGESAAFFEKMLARVENKGLPPVGTHLLMGDNAQVKLQNCLHNLKKDCLSVVLGLAYKMQ
jgi:ubiquinone/menaquinone biosynthesis C-methylase UbiE